MAQTFRQATAQTGNVNSPEWLMKNLGVFQGAWVQLDSENLPDSGITEGMVASNTFVEIDDDAQTTSVVLDNSQTFWQSIGSSGGSIHNVNITLDIDSLLTVTWSGGFSWAQPVGLGYATPTLNGVVIQVWDAVAFQIVVDGVVAVDTGWMSDAIRQNGTWIRGCVPVTAGPRNIKVEARCARIQSSTTGDPIYANATNVCTVLNRLLIWEARKA